MRLAKVYPNQRVDGDLWGNDMKRIFTGIAALAALAALIATPAFAADMAVKAPAPAVYDWSGTYLGLEAGGIAGSSRWTTTCLTVVVTACPDPPFFVDSSSPHTFNAAGFLGGAYVGVQKQVTNWVVGIEVEAAYSNANQSTAGIIGCVTFCGFVIPGPGNIDSSSVKLTGDGSIRARLGYVAMPNLLVYVTGGFALQGVEQTVTCSAAGPWCIAARNQTNGGWYPGYTVGGGLEWRYIGNWFVRLEGRYSNFNNIKNVFFGGTVDEVNTSMSVHTATGLVGLSYKMP